MDEDDTSSLYNPYFQRITPSYKSIDTSGGANNNLASGGVRTWNAGFFLLTSGLTRGTSANSRIGNKISYQRLRLNYDQGCRIAIDNGGWCLRMVLVYDKQCNGATPSVTTLWSADDVNAFPNYANEDRFIILYDKITECTGINNNFANAIYDVDIDLCGLDATFNTGNAGTIADMQTGAIYMTYACTPINSASNGGLWFRTRIDFTDL